MIFILLFIQENEDLGKMIPELLYIQENEDLGKISLNSSIFRKTRI